MKIYYLDNINYSGIFSTFDKALTAFFKTAKRADYKNISIKDFSMDEKTEYDAMRYADIEYEDPASAKGGSCVHHAYIFRYEVDDMTNC